MANKKAKFLKQQKIAVGGVLLTIVGILIYLFSVLATEVPLGEYEVRKHYTLIDKPRRIRGDKIEIMEFFSYGCVHCFNLDPNLENWVKSHQHEVNFIRVPAVGNELWRAFARAYYTMQTLDMLEEGHPELFGQIHNNGKLAKSAGEFADLLTNNATDREAFIKTYHSSNITKLMDRADQLARQFKIASVPNVVVDGKFLVKTNANVGLSRMLEVMNFLLEKQTSPLVDR